MIEAFAVSSMQQCVVLCRQEDLFVSIYDRLAICRTRLMHYTFLTHYMSPRIHFSVSGACIACLVVIDLSRSFSLSPLSLL